MIVMDGGQVSTPRYGPADSWVTPRFTGPRTFMISLAAVRAPERGR